MSKEEDTAAGIDADREMGTLDPVTEALHPPSKLTVQADPKTGVTVQVAPTKQAPVPWSDTEIGALLRVAVDKNITAENMEKLVDLYERLEDRKALFAFNRAFANFKADVPPIKKTVTAKIRPGFEYSYAPLEHICAVVDPVLHKHGFSYAWDSTTDKMLTVTCTLLHSQGHKSKASFTCPVETKAGMTEQQKHASALKYSQRQTLTSVLGITTTDEDNDGADVETLSESQIADIETLLSDLTPKVPKCRTRFLKFCGVDAVKDICVADYPAACDALEQMSKQT